MPILVATEREVVVIDVERGTSESAQGIGDRPTCLAAAPLVPGRAWCGTHRAGVFRSDDGGDSRRTVGLVGRLIMSVTPSPVDPNVVWVGTEPSEVWRSGNAGTTWEPTSRLETLPSSSEWSFPPRPDTHHVRWIACHPLDPNRLWVAIEAGALVSTIDGGRTWRDRVPGGPWDTHELAVHQRLPIPCASRPAMDISRATMAAARGARPAPVSTSAICAAWRSILSNRRPSWSQPHRDRIPPTSLAARTAGCIAVSRTGGGSASATAGQRKPAPSRRCSAPA
jgi:hypothetical protein